MKILILEDDTTFAQILYNDLFNYFSNISDKNIFNLITSNFAALPANQKYDLCFLDIDLNGDNGIDIAKKIKQGGICNFIIFVTAHQHLVYDSLSAQPYFFIRKNCYDKDLKILFELIGNSFATHTLITLKWRMEKKVIKLENVIYIEAVDHAILIHTIDGNFNDSRPLKEFLENANFPNFIQIHKTYAINMAYLLSYTSTTVLLTKNIEINIGRTYKNTFLESYQKYLVR